jgi:hypothetical protein
VALVNAYESGTVAWQGKPLAETSLGNNTVMMIELTAPFQ